MDNHPERHGARNYQRTTGDDYSHHRRHINRCLDSCWCRADPDLLRINNPLTIDIFTGHTNHLRIDVACDRY